MYYILIWEETEKQNIKVTNYSLRANKAHNKKDSTQ
jgi:hypothetical protein